MALAETTGLSVMQLFMLQQASLGMCTWRGQDPESQRCRESVKQEDAVTNPRGGSHCVEDSKDHNNIKCQKSEPTDVIRCVL